MLVKDFTKEIPFQVADDTLKNPSNCLKKCHLARRKNYITKDAIKG